MCQTDSLQQFVPLKDFLLDYKIVKVKLEAIPSGEATLWGAEAAAPCDFKFFIWLT